MRQSRRRLLALIPLAVGSTIVFGQEEPRLIAMGGTWHRPVRASLPTPLAAGYRVALPLVRAAGAPASIRFYGISGGVRIGPALSFAYGISALEYEVQIADAAGESYREEWWRDGVRQPQLDAQSAIPAAAALFVNRIQLNTGGPLPAGTYALHAFVAGFLAAEVQVAIM